MAFDPTSAAPAGFDPSSATPLIDKQEAKPLSTSDVWKGRARAAAQGLTFSFADELEALARSGLRGENYSRALEDIRRKYAAYAAERPWESTAFELAGSAPLLLVPGLGEAKAAQAAGVAERGILPAISRAAPAIKAGAAAGALSGVGAGEDLESRLTGGVTGGVLGGTLGAAARAVPSAAEWTRGVFGGGRSEAAATQRAQDVMLRTLQESGMRPQDVATRARLDRTYGIPSMVAQASPELTTLAETSIQRAGPESKSLAKEFAGQLAGAKERVKSTLQRNIPSSDYFAGEQDITDRLRANAKPLYEKAYEHGSVDDKNILDLLDAPDMKTAFQDAVTNSQRLEGAAKLRGEDPSQYKLTQIYEPRFNAQGDLVGHERVGQLPDVRTLDFMKQALDRRIDTLYKTGKGSEATALKDLRNAFVDKLDDIVPDYKSARAQYKGDIEVLDALRKGRSDIDTMRPQEVAKAWAAMGPDEREAFKSGVLQRLIQPIEDASGNRNVAQNIIGSEAWRDKLSAILPPRQYRVIKNALEREAELFSKTSGITGQSATANRLAARERLNSLIDQGDIEGAAVELMSYPSGWARMAVRALGKAANLSDRDAVYAKLANMLKQKDKAGIASLVKGLTDREEAIRAGAARRAAVETRGLRTAAAPIGPAGDVEKPKEEEPEELVIPNFGGESLEPGPGMQ